MSRFGSSAARHLDGTAAVPPVRDRVRRPASQRQAPVPGAGPDRVLRAAEEDIEAARRAGMRVVEDDSSLPVAAPSELPVAVPRGTIAGFPCYRTVEATYASASAIAASRSAPSIAGLFFRPAALADIAEELEEVAFG